MFDHLSILGHAHQSRVQRIYDQLGNDPSLKACEANKTLLRQLATLHKVGTVASLTIEELRAVYLYGPTMNKPDQATLDTEQMKAITDDAVQQLNATLDDIRSEIGKTVRVEHVIKINDTDVDLGEAHLHECFDDVLDCCAIRENVYMVGPAGSGKTTIASQVAQAHGLDIYCYGAISQAFEFLGYYDANGKYVETDFYRAFKHGGLVLMDEMDASNPNALLALNAALANDFASFPCGVVDKHEDFVVIASANTFGHGASAQYVGRNPMDAATLDRFCNVLMGYDYELERKLAGNDAWVDLVQAIREAIAHHKMRYVVSPRASIKGARLLSIGKNTQKVLDLVIWNKGFTEPDKTKIMADVDYGLITKVIDANAKEQANG